ncbi:hypothetical protein F5Y19DRAFT_481588 [Xylariaceae sp. FL1651]|nr:hypothetical protein F5Y19DRAFT_481588 [Xylariaceae sp. FL1651]
MAALSFLADKNISYFTIPVALFLPRQLRQRNSLNDNNTIVDYATFANLALPLIARSLTSAGRQALWPRSYSAFQGPGQKYFDPSNPRTFAARLEKSDLDKETVARILRAESASANGFEGLPVFAAAVVAGNSAGVSAPTMNALSITYVLSRVVYNWVYVFLSKNRQFAGVRSLTWFAGVGSAMAMFVSAGLKL